MNILLLDPPMARRSFLTTFSLPEPLTALYLGPILARHHTVRLADLRVRPDLGEALDGFVPDAAVVTVLMLTHPSLGRVLGNLRSRAPGVRVLLIGGAYYGGEHIVERPLDLTHPLADALVQPYALNALSQVVPEVLAAWEAGRPLETIPGLWLNRGAEGWTPTASLPHVIAPVSGIPDRRLLGKARGRYRFAGIGRMANTWFTYGCRWKCRFCPMSKFEGSVFASRPIPDVVAELEAMTEPNVFLEDYEPLQMPEAMGDLAGAIERAGVRKNWYLMTRADTALEQGALIARWRKVGLRWIYLGLDGSSGERLREIRKGASLEDNEEALRVMERLGLGVIVGFPVRSDFTHEEFDALEAYVRRLDPPLVGFTVETPLVGTRLFDEVQGRLTTRDWSLFDLYHAVLPTAMPLPDFYARMTRLHLLAGRQSLPGMLKHLALRDVARNWALGAGTLAAVRRSARDHAA